MKRREIDYTLAEHLALKRPSDHKDLDGLPDLLNNSHRLWRFPVGIARQGLLHIRFNKTPRLEIAYSQDMKREERWNPLPVSIIQILI